MILEDNCLLKLLISLSHFKLGRRLSMRGQQGRQGGLPGLDSCLAGIWRLPAGELGCNFHALTGS